MLIGAVIDPFRYKQNTDKQVTVLKFTDLDGDGIGMLRFRRSAPPFIINNDSNNTNDNNVYEY